MTNQKPAHTAGLNGKDTTAGLSGIGAAPP